MKMNSVALIGRLVEDVNEKTTTTGKKLARFRFALNNFDKSTVFITVNAFEKNAEFAVKYFKKGMKIGVVGYLSQYNKEVQLEGKDEVSVINFTELIAQSFTFCEKAPKNIDIASEIAEDDLPF